MEASLSSGIADSPLQDLINRLRPRLQDYLQHLGIGEEGPLQPGERIRCLHPDHDDQNPSMDLLPPRDADRPTRLFCRSQRHSADIFRVASWVEGRPENGPDWVAENVHYLAKLLNEPFQDIPVSPEEAQRLRARRLYEDAAEVLMGLARSSVKNDKVTPGFQHTDARGLTRETCIEYGVATVDWFEFLDTLHRYGDWDKDFVQDAGLTDKVFGRDFITFTLHDERGRVVGFDRRFVHYNADEHARARAAGQYYPPKFRRSNDPFGIMPPVLLYGLHRQKQTLRKLELVEGYCDQLMGAQAGHGAMVATLGTTTLSEDHLHLVAQRGFHEVCLVMDGDEAGRRAAVECLNRFENFPDLRLYFRFLGFPDSVPEKDRDPGTFFQMYSLDEFMKMPMVSALQMRVALAENEGVRGAHLVRRVLPSIAVEADSLNRGEMIRDLSRRSGVHEDDIREQVRLIRSRQTEDIAFEVRRALQTETITPDQLEAVLEHGLERTQNISLRRRDALGHATARLNVRRAMEDFYEEDGVVAGMRTGIVAYDEYLDGMPRAGFIVTGGTPNSGKTAFSYHTIHGLVVHDNPDNVCVVHSLDDNYQVGFAKLIAARAHLPIRWCKRPMRFIHPHPELRERYEEAMSFFLKAVEDGRLFVFGGESGFGIDTIQRSVRRAQEETGKHVTVLVDSFHNLWGHPSDPTEGNNYERNSKRLKQLATMGVSVLVTAECNKSSQGGKPRLKDLSETRALSYDADVVFVPYNQLNEEREQSPRFWVGRDSMTGQWVRKPVIQLEFEKNKVTDFKMELYLKFIDNECRFEHIPDIRPFMIEQNEIWARVSSGMDPSGNVGQMSHYPHPQNPQIVGPQGATP